MKDATIRGKDIDTSQIKYLVVEGDAIDIIRFPLVRFYEGNDLNDATILCIFEFEDGSGDADILTKELSDDEGLLYGLWEVKGNASSKSGKLQIQLKAIKDETIIFHTKPATITVEASLTPSELGEFTPTVLDQYLTLYQNLIETAETHSLDAQAAQGAAELARDKAEEWAENGEDVAVEEGQFSAKHHAIKASGSAGAASGSATIALGASGTATNKAEEARLSAVSAEEDAIASGNSASDALGSAGIASDKAAEALASEEAAAISAGEALASEEAAETAAGLAQAAQTAAEAAAANVQISSYYGLRRRSDGAYSSTGAAATMTSARSNGTYNPAISDFRKVKPWSDIRLCLMDKIKNVVAVQGDDNFTTMANATNPDGSHVWNFGALFFPFYMRIWEGVDESSFAFKEWDVSALKLPGYNMCPAFVREDGTIRPYIVIASYKTGLDTDNKVCSKPNVAPLVNTSTLGFDTKYTELDPDTKWLGNHFTTNDVWKMLVCIEFGTMDIQSAVGAGISSSMPYSSSSSYQLTEATVDGNSVTIADSGQSFYVGMDVQIGSSYSNNSYASNRKVTDVDTSTTPGSMIITVDGDAFSAPIGGWIVTWGQSDSVTNLLQIGTGCGWISQWDSEVRSHVYIYGLVDPYANVYEVERGKMRKAKHFWINFNPLTSSGITDPEASGYVDCGEFSTGAATSGWISDFKIVTLGLKQMQLVSAVGGNSIGDVIYYADDARTGTYVCFRGGYWLNGSDSGPFCVYWYYTPAYSDILRGDRGIILEPVLQAG